MEKTLLMVSSKNNFSLYKIGGVGRDNTPYIELDVESNDIAAKHVVSIYLKQMPLEFNGKPVQLKYYEAYVTHGMRCIIDSLEETEEYIEVLKEAVKFAKKVNSFIKRNKEWLAVYY